jgi:hypothetical protein
MGLHIQDVRMDITHLSEIKWIVGKKREVEVTQSLVFVVDMPKLKKDDLEYLYEHKGIDAWIVRLIALRGSGQQDLGSLYAPFKSNKTVRGMEGKGAASSVTMKLYYAATYASERFRSFKCPAFNHDKKVKSVEAVGENESFEISIGQASSYQERSQLIDLNPSSFNGGHMLSGRYFIEIAPYDSKRRMIHSNFKRIPKYVVVSKEENVPMKSCIGEHPELQQ